MAGKRNICLVHFSSYPGGAEVVIPEMLERIDGRKFLVFIIRPPAKDAPSVYSGKEISIDYGSNSNLAACRRLFIFALRNRSAIFHVINIGPLFLLVLRIAGIRRIVYSIHGTIYWKNSIKRLLLKILWKAAIDRKKYRFTSNTDFSGRVFFEKISNKVSMSTLYNPINIEKFTPAAKLSGEVHAGPRVIYAGRLAPGKGLEKWILTARQIHEKIPGAIFEIWGNGVLRSNLARLISDNDAEGYIFLRGHSGNIADVYRNADLLLFLSEYESFGNVVVESILCGTPVLASDIPSMREIFSRHEEFIIPGNIDIASLVCRKLEQHSSLKEECLKAADEFAERFSTGRHIEKLCQIYAEMDA